MEQNGFSVDLERKKELKVKYTQMRKEVHDQITESVGYELNVKSSPQKYELLYKVMGFKPYKKAPTSEDSIVKLMMTHCKGKKLAYKPILEKILEEVRIRTQESNYINFAPDYDQRCKTSFNISATETCRSSTGILKKPLRPRKMGLAFHTISKHGRLAKDIRSMFRPDKGKIFLQADSSQAEARVVAVLSRDWELLKAFDTVDIHRRTAALILGLTPNLDLVSPSIPADALIGKDSAERFCGKKTRHAGNYDMGKSRFMLEFNTDAQKFEINMEVSEWKAGQMLEKFHYASPKLSSVFHSDIQSALQSSRCLIDPYGGVRLFHGRMDDQLYKEGYANIPQRTVAHLVQGAALAVDKELGDEVGDVHSDKPVNWISENHDSLLLQVPENGWEKYAILLRQHMQTPISFNRYCTLKRDYNLVIPCELEISATNYAEMIKVKL
jgi:DNA polymerase I-like protein with 3'-5' exonuclease and polymerase domains